MNPRPCSATTAAGRPCRAWAVHDTDPPLCSTHDGRTAGAGAPAGNQNARRHGFYSPTLSTAELADLVAAADTSTLSDEIAITRIILRRLLQYLQEPDVDPAEIKQVAPLTIEATGRIARLLKDQQLISGEAADNALGHLGIALDFLAEQWDVEL